MARSKSAKKKSPTSRVKSPTLLPYRNPKLSPEKRVRDLMSRMTLGEKIAQMLCVWREKPQKLVDAEGRFDLEKAKERPERRRQGAPGRRRQGTERAPDGRNHQRHSEVLHREFAARHSSHVSQKNACTATPPLTAPAFHNRSIVSPLKLKNLLQNFLNGGS